jgi:NitT/TauT family transport system substrate-binding protein
VDATIAIASMARPVESARQAKIIGWVGDYVPYQITAVFTTERMIRDHADTLRQFGKAYQQSVDDYSDAFLRQDSAGKPVTDAKTDTAIAAVEKYVFTGDPNAKAKILAGVGYYSPHGGLDVADVRRQLAWFEAQGLVKTRIDPATIIDTDFIPPMNAA